MKSKKPPQFIDLIPGRLRVGVAEDAWSTVRGDYITLTIVTQGMRALDQKELVFSLQPGEDEGVNLIQEMLFLINNTYEQACSANIVDVGGITALGGATAGYFGPDGYAGFIYAHPTSYPGLVNHLAAVPLKQDELDVAVKYGQTRVLAKLGQRHMFYPFPPFGERNRPPVFSPADMESSVLGQSPVMWCYDSCVWVSDPGVTDTSQGQSTLGRTVRWRENRLTLMMGVRSSSGLPGRLSEFSSHGSLTLLTSVFPEIKNCLVYMPPSQVPSIIHAGDSDDARCAGNFITVAASSANKMVLVEDGFGLVLNTARWEEFLDALSHERPLEWQPEGEFPGFELSWSTAAS